MATARPPDSIPGIHPNHLRYIASGIVLVVMWASLLGALVTAG